ncbi:MAG TPA: hypothetical protein VKT78_00495, partial [Fimbriimonadaceae bacterium]|nr:hypothetical protein [Fimbriimonadaceae bacterium]
TLADVLPYGRVPREADYDRWTYLFAWSRGRLAEFYTYEGSGSSLYGEVYAQAGRRWRLVQSLDEHGELSMQGYNITDRIRSRNPAVVEFNFTDHEWLEKYFHGSHFAPGLKYRERWLFANGRLRRTVFYRVPNAMATLYDLKVDARHARRSDFDNRVPKAFRQQLWALLSKSPENRIGHDPTHDDHIDPDDSRDLLVDDYWRLHFAKTRRGWAPASMKYRKNGWW